MGVLAWGNRSVPGTDANAGDAVRASGGGGSATGRRSAAGPRTGAGPDGAAARLPRRPAGLEARAARRRDVGSRLERALIAAAAAEGCSLRIVEARWVPWASVTFSGARHHLVLVLDASVVAQAWFVALPDLELPISGHLVADLQVATVETVDGVLRAAIEALTVEEC